MNQIRPGEPLDERTEVGPISTIRQFAHVTGMVADTKGAGAVILTRGESLTDGYFVPSIILNGLSNSAKAAQQEIFGPVVTPIPFQDKAEAIALANDTAFGLAGAVWTAEVGRAHRMAGAVRAGTFWINSYLQGHPCLLAFRRLAQVRLRVVQRHRCRDGIHCRQLRLA